MRRGIVLAAALVAFAASQVSSVVHAQCSFNAPGKAKGFKAAMVRAYASCPGLTFPAPNSSTMAGVPACASPASISTYKFGPKGQCKVSMRANAKVPCGAPAFTPACSDPKFTVKCGDVTDLGGTPISDPGWEFNLIFRLTMNDDDKGDLTVIDTPLSLFIPPAVNGKLTLKAELNDFLCHFDPCSTLPTCASFEILSAKIHDPSGAVFATMGSSTR